MTHHNNDNEVWMSFWGRGPFQVCSFLRLSLLVLEYSLNLYNYFYVIVYIKFPYSNHCLISASWLIHAPFWLPFPILVDFIYLYILTKWTTTMVSKSQLYEKAYSKITLLLPPSILFCSHFPILFNPFPPTSFFFLSHLFLFYPFFIFF